jgi:hypothetical protein
MSDHLSDREAAARRARAGAIALVAFGALALWLALDLPAGTWRRMGPGYAPVLAAGGLIVAGILATLGARARAGDADPAALGRVDAFLVTLCGVLLFALLVERAGGIAAAAALGALSGIAAQGLRLAAAAGGALIGIATLLAFAFGLGVPLALLPR